MQYNREAAVKYAETWWDKNNPEYRGFELNCTNFVSQCIRAGGAPMRGYPNRSVGWWYTYDNWSFSWSVAHSLYWYLKTSTTGLKAEEMPKPEHLVPGDVICYDFSGNGSWGHNTIVVAKDESDMPLVNAHTESARMREWSYEDSPSWTQQTQYGFFHIVI